jgi:hypothetical protein
MTPQNQTKVASPLSEQPKQTKKGASKKQSAVDQPEEDIKDDDVVLQL